MGEKSQILSLGSFSESRLQGIPHRAKPRKEGQKVPRKAPTPKSDAKKEAAPPKDPGKGKRQSKAARAASLANLAKARAVRATPAS